jgi:hypothetical protein
MTRFVKDGKVAVVVASDYSCRWFTNHGVEELLFDPNIVSLVLEIEEAEDKLSIAHDIETYCDSAYGERSYYGDSMNLEVQFVPMGSEISVKNINGWEEITEGNIKV